MDALIIPTELASYTKLKPNTTASPKVEIITKPIRPSLISIKLRLPFKADEKMLVTYTDQLGLFKSLQKRGSLIANVAYDIDWIGDSTMIITNPVNGELVVECQLPEKKPVTIPNSIH